MNHRISLKGSFNFECRNESGKLAWKRLAKNMPTNGGLDYVLQVAFANGTKLSSWFAGLIDKTGFAQLSQNDTMVSHAGWLEFTGFSGNRPQWTNQEASQVCYSNGAFSWPITSSGIIHGAFIVSTFSKGTTTGTLWSTALLPSGDNVVSIGQTLTGTYSVNAS